MLTGAVEVIAVFDRCQRGITGYCTVRVGTFHDTIVCAVDNRAAVRSADQTAGITVGCCDLTGRPAVGKCAEVEIADNAAGICSCSDYAANAEIFNCCPLVYMTEQALVIGTGVNINVLYCVALTVINALKRVVDIADGRPRVAVDMIFIAHVNISGHEEDDALGLAACINILLERLKVVKSVYAVCITLNAVRTRGKELTYACGRSVVAVVFFVRITILELTGRHEPRVVPGMVTFTDKRHGVAPAAVLPVILQKHPCVERIKKTCGSDIVNLGCFFECAVVVILLKAVRKGEDVYLRAGRCAVISALSGIFKIVAVFDGRFSEDVACDTTGDTGLTACAERCAVGHAIFNSGIVHSANDTAGLGLSLDADICPAVCDGAAV